jgi:iron-sulfur cluster assembly protein
MLTLTENASTIVKDLAGRATGSADGGLRISTTAADVTDYEVSVTPAAQPDDQVVDAAGAHVFLEKNAADALADKVLDAKVDDEGAVRFIIANQA